MKIGRAVPLRLGLEHAGRDVLANFRANDWTSANRFVEGRWGSGGSLDFAWPPLFYPGDPFFGLDSMAPTAESRLQPHPARVGSVL